MTNAPKLLTLTQVCERTTLSRFAIDCLLAKNDFPRPIYLSPRRIAYVEAEVNAWIKRRASHRVRVVQEVRDVA